MSQLRILILSLLLAALGASSAASQFSDAEKLAAKKEKTFFKSTAWVQDFEKAKILAGKKNSLIFAYFTRSYAP